MKPKEISQKLTAVLRTVTRANGFNTDAGDRVFRGKLKLDESVIPCIVIGEADDVVNQSTDYGSTVSVEQQFAIDAYVQCDPDNPNDAAHDVIEDLKKVLFTGAGLRNPAGALQLPVKKLSYVKRSIGPRPDGASFVMGSITIKVVFPEDLSV